MFYRVRADLPFTDRDEALDFYHDCQLALPKATTINPDMPNEEKGYIILEQCEHDKDPAEPCTTMASETT